MGDSRSRRRKGEEVREKGKKKGRNNMKEISKEIWICEKETMLSVNTFTKPIEFLTVF